MTYRPTPNSASAPEVGAATLTRDTHGNHAIRMGFRMFTAWFAKAMARPGATFQSVAAEVVRRENTGTEILAHIRRSRAYLEGFWSAKFDPAAQPSPQVLKARQALIRLFDQWCDDPPLHRAEVDKIVACAVQMERTRLSRERAEFELKLTQRKDLLTRTEMARADKRLALYNRKLAFKHNAGFRGIA
jgi:hypothetical protein